MLEFNPDCSSGPVRNFIRGMPRKEGPLSNELPGGTMFVRVTNGECWLNCRWPDFFIIGAPKAGTSSLAKYLSEHPKICFSRIKEPHFFSTDIGSNNGDLTQEEYLGLFDYSIDDALLGEASTDYLWSETAVPHILAVRPDAKFIVILRDPATAVPSFHATLVKSGIEDVMDVERAWRLQERRASGQCLPARCQDEKRLRYKEIFMYGEQIERLYSLVSREKILIFVFDDFIRDPSRCYRDVLRFLNIPDDGRVDFPVLNQRLVYRSKTAFDLMHRPPSWMRSLTRPLKTLFDARWNKAKSIAKTRLAARPGKQNTQRSEFEAELRQVFAEDIAKLSRLIGRDLSSWTRPRQVPRGL